MCRCFFISVLLLMIAGAVLAEGIDFSIQTNTEVVLVKDSIAFGSGYVNGTTAVIDSEGNTNGQGTWDVSELTGLVVENTGTTNIELNLTANDTADTLIDGTSPTIKWKLTDTDSGCTTETALTDYIAITTDNSTQACSVLTPNSTIRLNIELTIPDSAVAGNRTLLITAIATDIS